jgi:carbon monoxide dehydrogenase subunit G
MEFKGRYVIPAAAETVWAALNDPEVLRACVPGCDVMEKTDDTHFLAAATLKIGPVKATFRGKVELAGLDPPRRCTLKGEGQGGVAGFARGEAEVLMEPEDGATVLTYTAQAAIGGKLAQIGQRLIDGAAKQIADEFFTRFAAAVSAMPTAALDAVALPDAAPEPVPVPQERPETHTGLAPKVWVVGLIAVIVVLLAMFGVVTR